MASGPTFVIAVLSFCLIHFGGAAPIASSVSTCPFTNNNCSCIADSSSANVFRNVSCWLTVDHLSPFDAPAGAYAVTGTLQIIADVNFQVPANAFAAFKSIGLLQFYSTLENPAVPLTFDPQAFAGTQIYWLWLTTKFPLPDAIRSLTNLEKLIIIGDNIITIGPNQFEGLTSLTSLYIYASVRDMHKDAFVGLEDSLTELIWNGEFGPAYFPPIGNLKKLQQLNLAYLEIGDYKSGDFANFPDLRTLDLTYNDVPQAIDSGAFDGISNKIESLTLDNCGLSEIPSFIANLTRLSYLSMENNGITTVRAGDFPEKNKLTSLDWIYNVIHTVEPGALRPLKHLRSLVFEHEQLNDFDLALLDGMEKLENVSFLDPLTEFGGYLRTLSVSSVDQVVSLGRFQSSLSNITPLSGPVDARVHNHRQPKLQDHRSKD